MTSALRRLGLAIFAIAISAALLRTQLSSALVTRGDTLAYWGRRDAARDAYRKALFLDPRNGVAADRYAFDSLTRGGRDELQGCILVASRYLESVPHDGAVLMDRALCYQHEHLMARAIEDFRRAGKLEKDARAFTFAAFDERARHQDAAARELLQEALAVDPGFLPARLALARM